MAVIGRKQGLAGLLGLVHDGGHPFLKVVENGRYTLLPALFHQPDSHHLARSIPHAVIRGNPGNRSTAAPTGSGNGDLILVFGKPPPVVLCLLPAAGDLRLFPGAQTQLFLRQIKAQRLVDGGHVPAHCPGGQPFSLPFQQVSGGMSPGDLSGIFHLVGGTPLREGLHSGPVGLHGADAENPVHLGRIIPVQSSVFLYVRFPCRLLGFVLALAEPCQF